MCLSIVTEIHEDLEKAKKDSRKDRVPPRAPKDKPTVVEGKDDTLMYAATVTFNPRRGGYILIDVCLFVSMQDYAKTAQTIFAKIGRGTEETVRFRW